ncbi:MAG: exodeoxyribonuclease V subunit gamma [Pseudoflavonifractor sp.]|nr:exodeoxyribonuclease V subunit gamma [Alloprevotella sp.]MCM1116352.1 exodeoxyribonuclease V subunit gamma [Pseudoflavonifractor sp.]
MTPMLRQVARAYLENHSDDELSRYCFVFPNKRSATFFLRYLDLEASRPHIEPEVTAIADFVATFSPLSEAPHFMQIATLYDAYRKESAKEVEPFDRFLFWGETLLTDFAEVDRYLVDPDSLFTNIRELREINSTYLTDVQRDIIRRFWGIDDQALNLRARAAESDDGESERFWTHLDEHGNPLTTGYTALWQLLLKVYRRFNKQLAGEGYCTSGHHYRNAAERLHAEDLDTLPLQADRYIFVGFNLLSTAEMEIFDQLNHMGLADFYWDISSPVFSLPGNRTGEMALRGAKMFPSRYELEEDSSAGAMPEIEIIGVASGIGQVKVASSRLQQWTEAGLVGQGPEDATGTDTAIVLADETMLMPLLCHLPSSLPAVNVTMGFPIKLTPIAAVMHTAALLQSRMRHIGGSPAYFYEDVVGLLSQPVVRAIAPKAVDDLMNDIRQSHRVTIEVAWVRSAYPALSPLFALLEHRKGETPLEGCREYFIGLIDLFSRYADEESRPVERRFLEAYRMALDDLIEAFSHRGITMDAITMATIIERALATATVSFTGEPLEGVQVMGVLETRSLDFDNIIMLSMNEDIFPKRHSRPSFILETLRPAFGLPSREIDESVMGYYFFRLLTRARRVTLLYDARTVGMEKVGEMSRYLSQLLYLFPEAKIVHRTSQFSIPAEMRERLLTVPKTGEVRRLLEQFKDPKSHKRLSASSLNNYINCQLNFYLTNVCGLEFPTETEGADYMDWAVFGSVVHDVAEKLYKDMASASVGGVISRDTLSAMAANHPKVSRYVTAAINRKYLHKVTYKDPEECYDPLRGSEELMGRVITELICRMLHLEAETFGEIPFVGAEVTVDGQVEFAPGLNLNVRLVIDRADRAGANGALRFIDFKTGADKIEFSSVADAFDNKQKERPKVLFQLLFYCYCYMKLRKYDGPIQPFVYLTRKLFTDPLNAPCFKIDRQRVPIIDHREHMEEFEPLLQGLIEEIFDYDRPFVAAINDPEYDGHSCKYCRFKSICEPPEK